MSKNIEDLTREELLEMVKALRRTKKFGLVWEDKPEDVVEQCKRELPVLEEVAERAITLCPDEPTNIIIEGDNYHALSVLSYTHAGRIDVIYIDPPYNTGARDWKYNNDYVDINDSYRHSKWLSMMAKRLELGLRLLSSSGIMCITIDDNEVHHLRSLIEEYVPAIGILGTVVIRSNPSGRSTTKGFAVAHEYAIFIARTEQARIGRFERTPEQQARYGEHDDVGSFEWVNFRKHGGADANRQARPRMYYPIYASWTKIRIPHMEWKESIRKWLVTEAPRDDELVILPINEQGIEKRWKWGHTSVLENIDNFTVRPDRSGKPGVYMKSRPPSEGTLPLTWWDSSLYSATDYGTNLLARIMSRNDTFPFPKSKYAVVDCLRAAGAGANKSALILDFFAGSGTTGHATLELNRADGGKRQFILCTNNENGIAEEVTYPRIRNVINGYADVEGIPANVRYFKTAFVPKSDVSDDTRYQLVERATDMIRVREGTYDLIAGEGDFRVFQNEAQTTAILYSIDALAKLKACLHSLKDKPAHIYVFSLTHDTYEEDFADLEQEHSLKPIPESILEVYRRVFVSR